MLTAKFIISNLFTSQSGDIDIQKKDLNETGHIVVSAGLSNCGVIGKTNKKAKIMPANSITVDMFGNAFYRDEEYKITTHARVFALLPKFTMTKEIGLYISACMKYFQKKFSYSNMCSWKKICDLTLILPVQVNETGKPIIDSNKQFDSNGYFPDWNYMQDYIEKLEQEHISELEMELDAYLRATSLNDYELTEDDKHILASKLKNEDGKEPVKESEPLPEGGWWKEGREFLIDDLFAIKKGRRLTKANQTPGKIPFIGSTETNNGITAYIGQKPIFEENAITVSYNGSVGQVFYQEEPFWASDDVNVLYLKNHELNALLYCYIGTAIKKAGEKFSYSYKWNLKRMKETYICLPIQTDDSGKPVIDAGKTYSPKGYIPDWEYMEKYIKATEKEIIKEVVLYKDKVIEKAKEIAGAA